MEKENRSLKILRVKYGLTQEGMAKKLGMSRQTYAKIENGMADGSIQFWAKVQRAFKISSEEMWQLVNDKQQAEV